MPEVKFTVPGTLTRDAIVIKRLYIHRYMWVIEFLVNTKRQVALSQRTLPGGDFITPQNKILSSL